MDTASLHFPTESPVARPLPLRIVSGFLGSGKTTLVNRVLEQGMGSAQRVGVIVNEFGPISIDDRLISRQSDSVIELANGCVCCSMQKDLMTTLSTLLQIGSDLDYVLLETTGLADPLPLMGALMAPEMAPLVRLDAVITVVDGEHFDENLEHAEVAYNQITSADVLLLNKADTVSESQLDQMESGLRKLNRDAVVVRAVRCAVDLDQILEMTKTRAADQALQVQPDTSLDRYSSAAFTVTTALPRSRWEILSNAELPILRAKGFLWCTETDEQVVFQRVGKTSTIEPRGPWPPGISPRAEVVLIVKDSDAQAVADQIAATLETELSPDERR